MPATPNPTPGKVLPFVLPGTPPPADDAPARALALDTRRSCIVEAPAGSGKTGLLVQRLLKLLADPATQAPEEVLAVTFTNKATAELQERVLKALHEAAASQPLTRDDPFQRDTRAFALAVLARDRELHWGLLAQPQRLNIRTFDAICLALTNALPLLSGAGGPRQPALDALPLYRAAAHRTLLQLGRRDDPQSAALHAALETVILHRDANLGDCETLIAQMLGSRDQWAELLPHDLLYNEAALDAEVRPRLEATLEAVVCAGLTRALDAMPAGLLHDLTALAARLGIEPGYSGDSPIALCADRHEPPEAIAEHLDHWRALIFLLLKPSDGGWRASYARNHIRFEIPKRDAAYLKELVTTIQSDALQQALAAVFALPPSRYPDEQWHVAKALFLVLRHALAELQLLFADRAECDFIEFSLNARAALSAVVETQHDDAPDLALAAGGHLRHLLVDEMQDTSAAQYDLIQLLTHSWDGVSQTVFLVGDPKQSIYLFRKALVGRFLRTMQQQRLGEIALTPLQLTANFRSQAPLVHAFNDVFSLIFPTTSSATSSNDVPFVAAQPTRPAKTTNLGAPSIRSFIADGWDTTDEWDTPEAPHNKPGGPSFAALSQRVGSGLFPNTTAITWHTAILTANTPTEDHREHEAETLVGLIADLIAANLTQPPPSRIAVLALNRPHLAATVAELKRRNIPFRGIELDRLDELPEVLDVLALTRALLHPADRIAWLAILRAPWCGLSLADLLTLTGTESAEPDDTPDPTATIPALIATRANRLTPLGQQLLARIWPTLQTALDTLGRTALSLHVERTWHSLGGAAPLDAQQQSNVARFFAVLRDLERTSPQIELTALTTRLKKLYAEPLAGPDIHVDLLTIHAAKGLEWDIVLVPGLERPPRASTTELLNWAELDPSGNIVIAPIYGKGQDSDTLNRWLRAQRIAQELAERKRLFYVATTRAREHLHLFASAKVKKDGDLAKPPANSLLAACWPAAASQFVTTPSAEAPHTLLDEDHPLAIAAAEEPVTEPARITPYLQRLPLTFDPAAALLTQPSVVPFAAAATLPVRPTFTRPDGSFAVRAFGNVVHRYLQLLADRLATEDKGDPPLSTASSSIRVGSGSAQPPTPTPDTLLAEVALWHPRLLASLRGEGLPPAVADREATRAQLALTNTLTSPVGRWLLSPLTAAASEATLLSQTATLRVDRTFLAGPTPFSTGDTHLWIVDFKTTAPGSRAIAGFALAEQAKYLPQLESYAAILRAAAPTPRPIQLALFYPLAPGLLDWPSDDTPTPIPRWT